MEDRKAPDYDQFLSCYDYCNTFPTYTAKFESKIKEFVETTDNPFDLGTGNLSTDNRADQLRKNKGGTRLKRFELNEKIDKDSASKKGIVNILYDST